MSVAQRINQLIDMLDTDDGQFRFDSIIDLGAPEAELRHQLVVTLLAILELAKLKVARVLQDPSTETFYIARKVGTTRANLAAARRAESTFDGGRQPAAVGDAVGPPDDAEPADASPSAPPDESGGDSPDIDGSPDSDVVNVADASDSAKARPGDDDTGADSESKPHSNGASLED
jgi:hypothetical protein